MSTYKGRLIRWNDEKGYGFIENGSEKNGVFLHISELVKMNRRPVINDIILYDLLTTGEKTRAVNAVIEGVKAIKEHHNKRVRTSTPPKKSRALLTTILTLAILLMVYRLLPNYHTLAPQETIKHQEINQSKFACDGRTRCSQMKSKAEALFFIENCPNTQMDGDHDGDPCEGQF